MCGDRLRNCGTRCTQSKSNMWSMTNAGPCGSCIQASRALISLWRRQCWGERFCHVWLIGIGVKSFYSYAFVHLHAVQICYHLEAGFFNIPDSTSVLTFGGRLWPLGCLVFCLSCPFRFFESFQFALRISFLSHFEPCELVLSPVQWDPVQ